MRGFAFYPTTNMPGRRDAAEFQHEAFVFAELHGLELRAIPNDQSMSRRRNAVSSALLSTRVPLDCVAFFCHGWQRGIQAGYALATVKDLARRIAVASTPDVVVPLYACSAARGGVGGDGGFADRLRDELCRYGATGCRVYGHTTAGHCTRNPFVRVFEGPLPAQGGHWVTAPAPPSSTRFKAALQADGSTLPYLFPFLGPEELHSAVLV